MINFPRNFRALKNFPGYFWNVNNKRLYTMKVTGVLRELKLQKPFHNHMISIDEPYYSVSKNGQRKVLRLSRIPNMLEIPHTIPVQEKFDF